MPASRSIPVLATVSLCMLAAAAPAQFVGPGLSWSGGASGFVSSFVPGCQNLPVAVLTPDTVTIQVWGDVMSPFGLFASLGTGACVTVPGIAGGVLLDAPIVPLAGGLLTQVTPCLACPPGFTTLQFAVPPGVPAATAIAIQAIAVGGGNFAFTVAITATV